MNYKIALGAGLLLFLMSVTSCFRERTCRDKAPLTAAFKIEEEIGNFVGYHYVDKYNFVTDQVKETDYTYYSETDTVLAGGIVFFTALEEGADRYEWTIGGDPRTFEGRDFSLRFFAGTDFSSFTPTSVGITLRVFRDHPFCFPEDTLAVQHREMVVVPLHQSAILGRYRGSSTRFPDQPHEIDIMLSLDTWGHSIDNFPRDCRASFDSDADTLRGVICGIGYKALSVAGGGVHYGEENCHSTVAIGELDDNRRLRIRYSLSGFPPSEENNFIYEGSKIQ